MLSEKVFSLEQDFPLPKEAVWKLLSDNDRLNLFIGLFPVKFSAAKKNTGEIFYREALAKVAGIIPLTWKEYPFQWVENESYTVERKYLTGPLAHFVGGIELLDSETILHNGQKGTKLRVIAKFIPRNILGLAAIPITGVKSMHNTMNYVKEYLELVQQGKELYLPKVPGKHKVNVTELNRLQNTLKKMPVSHDLINLLHIHILEEGDQDVSQMKPTRIAHQWGEDPDEVLRLFLYATKAGILNLSWNLICPNCRVSKEDYKSLSQLESQFHCDLCGINYDANFENYVELCFDVHPLIRRAYAQVFCVGSPMITPHIKIQKVVQKGKSVTIPISCSNESVRFRVLQSNHIVGIEKSEQKLTVEQSLVYTDNGWSTSTVRTDQRNTVITIQNQSATDQVVVLEKICWSNEVVTAAKVTALQEFRDLFSSEVLAPGQQVGIQNVTILFSDLQGSTSLYETVGDANAYGQVRRHFEYLTEWVKKNNGSIVKTIGDAVMAVFYLPEDGMKAALQIQKHVFEFNEVNGEEIILKIGLYSGPAIAVNSNDRLDYFGRTVNIAARIQGQSIGDDVVISNNYLRMEKIRKVIESEETVAQPFKAELKGIQGEADLIRLSYK